MSTQDPITEMLNAMEQNPDIADVFRTRILGDDFKEITELLLAVLDFQDATSELVSKSSDLSMSTARVIAAVQTRQRGSEDAIAGLQHEQEAMQSAIANVRADIESMAANQSRMEEAIGQLQSDVATLKSDVSTLKSDMTHVRGRLDNLAGASYEFKVQKNLGSIAGQHLRLRRTRTLKGPRTDDDQDLRERVDDAEDRGIITESENHDMWLLDLIFSGQRREDRAEVLVAVEISITAGDDDISRAKERAETLYKATDTKTIPVVIAEHIDQERQEADEQAGVFIIPVPEI
ncbi:MAG: hypothetical protein OXL37_00290 [Chloroflexota bacterium]|nr:hypothetical protein [Chloroflexota bacterium]MDE2959770.1 hypothetical protein [Chloroflexota bacterium]